MVVNEAGLSLKDRMIKRKKDPENVFRTMMEYAREKAVYESSETLSTKCATAYSIIFGYPNQWEQITYMLEHPEVDSRKMRVYLAALTFQCESILAEPIDRLFQKKTEDMQQEIFDMLYEKSEKQKEFKERCDVLQKELEKMKSKTEQKGVNLSEDAVRKLIASQVEETMDTLLKKRKEEEEERQKEEEQLLEIASLRSEVMKLKEDNKSLEMRSDQLEEKYMKALTQKRTFSFFRKKTVFTTFHEAMEYAKISKKTMEYLLFAKKRGVSEEELLELINRNVPEENMPAVVALLIAKVEKEKQEEEKREEEKQKRDIARFGYATAIPKE